MTDPMELAGRLDRIAEGAFPYTASVAAEAAACIREMAAQRAGMQARLDRWEPRAVTTPMLPVGEHKRCNKILAALGQAYPRTCFVCRMGPCRTTSLQHQEQKMNRVHSAASGSIPVEGRSYVRDELQRLVDDEDARFANRKVDRNAEATARGVGWLAARLALINAERMDELSARIKDTTHGS